MAGTTVAKLLDLGPIPVNICFSRGDTKRFTFTLSISGSPVDLTGASALLTVDTSPSPADAVNNLFVLTGVIAAPLSGVIEFQMSAVQADQTPSKYFFDVQLTDGSGDIQTIIKGDYIFAQDITK